ncbi:Uncharacterized protein DBV15_05791, partial [Temnothorax longispinosus]
MAPVPPCGKPNEGGAAAGTEGAGFLSVKDNETALGGGSWFVPNCGARISFHRRMHRGGARTVRKATPDEEFKKEPREGG